MTLKLRKNKKSAHKAQVLATDAKLTLHVNADLARYNAQALNAIWFPPRPENSIVRMDPFFSTHQYSPVARLVSSTHDADSLYGQLIWLSLTDDSLPSLASRHALSALSYQHLQRNHDAVAHQTRAIRALQAAIETPNVQQTMQMMTASMLLSIFETLNFESSDLSWSIFFCGTKKIASLVTQKNNAYFGDEALIMDWIFYHDVMYKFSICHWMDKNMDQIELAAQEKIMSKAVFSPERQTIVSILGCSLELLDLLCQIINVVGERHDPSYRAESHKKNIVSLEMRLESIDQRHAGVSALDLNATIHEVKMAELFRLAALLYLLRAAKGEPKSSEAVIRTAENSFDLLGEVEYYERPWPLFVIALEAHTDDQRIIISRVLKHSLQRRPLGTMALVKRMIHDAWIQQDLHDGDMDILTLYGQIISKNRVPPCFA
ncbi:hypothetical protein PT974_04617 [Cladobotryum mycophilum]|uniref:Uncharacterized protein n=1 Tax=Cladobotryum mycophilum TaxID=491253 RepID=A0ABR0SVP5_9HYPO